MHLHPPTHTHIQLRPGILKQLAGSTLSQGLERTRAENRQTPYLAQQVLQAVSHDAFANLPICRADPTGPRPGDLPAGLRHQLLGHHCSAHCYMPGDISLNIRRPACCPLLPAELTSDPSFQPIMAPPGGFLEAHLRVCLHFGWTGNQLESCLDQTHFRGCEWSPRDCKPNKSPSAVSVAGSWTSRIPLWTTLLCGRVHFNVKWGEMGVGVEPAKYFWTLGYPG